MSGMNFCSAAYNGILLQMKHAGKFAFGNYLAAGFILLGKLGLTVANVFIAWFVINNVTGTASKLSNPYGPLILVGLTTFGIVSVFLGLFDETVLAIMTSASADMDLHKGLPKWGPQSLHEVIHDLFPQEEIDKIYTPDGKDDEEKKGKKEDPPM